MDTKEKIIDSLIELASVKGLGKTSLNDIAGKVGINKASIYYYYPSKQKMIEDMYFLIRKKSTSQLSIDTSIPLKSYFRNSFQSYLKLCTSTKMKKVFIIIESEKYMNKEAAELYIEESNHMVKTCENVLEKYAEDKKIIISNLPYAARSYAFYAHELIMRMILDNKDYESEINSFLDGFMSIFIKEL